MSLSVIPFGRLSDGREVTLYRMTNEAGFSVDISNFGATIVRILAPDAAGRLTDVVLGYDSPAEYEIAEGYLGATVGRFANRIAGGCFSLDGQTYSLAQNDGRNHIHGGTVGYSHRIWQSTVINQGATPSVRMSLFSPDGDEGYPGNLSVSVTFSVTKDNALSIEYYAETDRKTIVNLTNHTYFNLGGYASGDVLGHKLTIDAGSYLRTDPELIPTGEIRDVTGTPFDFRREKVLGQDLTAPTLDVDIRIAGGGYDHCFNFTDWQVAVTEPVERVRATDPVSGRRMTLLTTLPCVQLYTANFLNDPRHPLKGGYPQQLRHGFCLETQTMPDSPHYPGFASAVLTPEAPYRHVTVLRFDAVR